MSELENAICNARNSKVVYENRVPCELIKCLPFYYNTKSNYYNYLINIRYSYVAKRIHHIKFRTYSKESCIKDLLRSHYCFNVPHFMLLLNIINRTVENKPNTQLSET